MGEHILLMINSIQTVWAVEGGLKGAERSDVFESSSFGWISGRAPLIFSHQIAKV